MKYDKALQLWGKRRIEDPTRRYGRIPDIDPDTVTVHFEFNKGFACCGGSDPGCYCSYAESPSAHVAISGQDDKGLYYSALIDYEDFDFASVLGEIIDAGDGFLNK